MAARPAPYLDDLNPAQRAAVEALDGPVLMLAGAGTGKTKALTARIVHLLHTGTRAPERDPRRDLHQQGRARDEGARGPPAGPEVEGMPWLGTFHSICVKLLRRHAELVGLKSNFTILDTDDQMRLLKQLILAANIDEKRWPARMLAGLIDGWKNRALDARKGALGRSRGLQQPRHRALRAYQDRLRT
jgi:DNA helicase II / ATP-dependent DNA helicase PcrA